MNKVQQAASQLAPLFKNHDEKVKALAKEISEKKEMKKWEYYQTWTSPCWRINNKETNMFFQTEYEEYAEWLVDKLNSLEEIKRFDDGIMLTDDGDLVKVKQ